MTPSSEGMKNHKKKNRSIDLEYPKLDEVLTYCKIT